MRHDERFSYELGLQQAEVNKELNARLTKLESTQLTGLPLWLFLRNNVSYDEPAEWLIAANNEADAISYSLKKVTNCCKYDSITKISASSIYTENTVVLENWLNG